MSDVLARAAEVLGAHGEGNFSNVNADLWCASCDVTIGPGDGSDADLDGLIAEHIARKLADAGLLAESAPVAGGNGAVSGEQSHPRPTTPVTVESLTARLVAARAATDGYRTEAERLRELLDEAHAKIERMEEL